MAELKVLLKKFKRGEHIYLPDKNPTTFYIVKSGTVSHYIKRDEQIIQLGLVRAGGALREEALSAAHGSGETGAIALTETVVQEFSSEAVRTAMSQYPQPIDQFFVGLLERLKKCHLDLKEIKIAEESQPCPPSLTANLFGVMFHTVRYLGTPQEGGFNIEWKRLSEYASEMFFIDRLRLEEAIRILAKLRYAEWEPKGSIQSEDWGRVVFKNMFQIEAFFEFYQNYYFKGGDKSFLKTNDKAIAMTQALVTFALKFQADRSGLVTVPYLETLEFLRGVLGPKFDTNQIFTMAQRGLMVKRTASQEGGTLSFLKQEFEQMLLNWKLLREIEQWNIQGYVNNDLPYILNGTESSATGSFSEKTVNESSSGSSGDLEAWKPLVLTGKKPTIRTESQRRGEFLCPFCLSVVTAKQQYCDICDTDLPPRVKDQ